jgi:hypothetical protein
LSLELLSARRVLLLVLCVQCLLRCRRLIGHRSRKGALGELARFAAKNPLAGKIYRAASCPEIAKGDYAIVFGELVEIVGSARSKYGYRSLKVRYLRDTALHREDWFPATYATKFIDYDDMKKKIIALLTTPGEAAPTIRGMRARVRETVTGMWAELRGGAT